MKEYNYFCSAFSNMKQLYKYNEPYSDIVVLTGLVGLYKICFEQSWKMMKEILSMHGYEASATGSPKIILKLLIGCYGQGRRIMATRLTGTQ